jgi:hypothetical protein
MLSQVIFLSVKDLMRLTGNNNYNSSANHRRAIRDSLSTRKKIGLTIHEYRIYEQINFEYVWRYLREGKMVRNIPL